MQVLRELSPAELKQRLADGKLPLQVGPYIYNIQSNLPSIGAGIGTLYADFYLASPQDFIDYDVAMCQQGLWQRLRGQAEFLFDQQSPFEAFDRGQAYAFLEWGMNWCVSLHTNEYLKLHAAVVARDNSAIIMPGTPGAGKSTLCAALGLSGWRILSDEHAMIPPGSTSVIPLCRPVSLKNDSIELIRGFFPNAVFGPVSEETHKGVVAHMKADLHPDSHDSSPVPARLMIFPRFSQDEEPALRPRRRSESFILAAYHAFNYSLLCETGFDSMQKLIENLNCYDLVYRDLDWAVQVMNDLTELKTAP